MCQAGSHKKQVAHAKRVNEEMSTPGSLTKMYRAKGHQQGMGGTWGRDPWSHCFSKKRERAKAVGVVLHPREWQLKENATQQECG